MPQSPFHADVTLARRLENTEAEANAQFVEARARLFPEIGARWIEVAGARCMFDGPRSPCTQTFGLGIHQVPTAADLDQMEAFFHEQGAPVFHETCPLVSLPLYSLLHQRGYEIIEVSNVLVLPLAERPQSRISPKVIVTVANPDEEDQWAATAAEGWKHLEGIADLMRDLARVVSVRENGVCFFAKEDGHPIATGALSIHNGIALFAGASTVPEFRNRGAQHALLSARLDHATAQGCDLAMMCTEPGSASQRNAERTGFRVAYTRSKFGLISPPKRDTPQRG